MTPPAWFGRLLLSVERAFHVVLAEHALHAALADPDVMEDQLRHLLEASRLPRLRLGTSAGRPGTADLRAFTVEITQMLNVYPDLSNHQPTCQVCPEGWLCAD